ncbi:MAG TPA: DUF2336 domain-containing protein [Pseudolabrys sp.]|nr:DUF2336 domain-containing protein [Pseudolabrys sp.]
MVKSSADSPIDRLVDLACRDGIDIRPTLLRVVTDLYVQKPAHTAEEETQYVELALGLIASADEPTRAVVTQRLRAYAGAPAAVLRRLGVPAPVAETPAAEVPPAREPPEADDLADVFFAASPQERRLILANLDLAALAAAPPVATADTPARLESAALKRNTGELVRTLEVALGVTRELAERIVSDGSGEPLVVAAKALGMPAPALQRILLVLDPAIGQSIARVYGLAQLFEELTPATAAHMVAIWRAPPGRARPPHEPAYWDDERRGVRQRPPHRRENSAQRDPRPRRSTRPDRNESRG